MHRAVAQRSTRLSVQIFAKERVKENKNQPRFFDDLKEAPVMGALFTIGKAGVRAMFIPTGPSWGLPDGLVSRECLIALVIWQEEGDKDI